MPNPKEDSVLRIWHLGFGSFPLSGFAETARTASRLLLCQAAERDAVGAPPVSLNDVFGPLDRCVRPQHLAERVNFGPAEPLALRRGDADRAVILNQDVTPSLCPGLRHVPLPRPHLGQ